MAGGYLSNFAPDVPKSSGFASCGGCVPATPPYAEPEPPVKKKLEAFCKAVEAMEDNHGFMTNLCMDECGQLLADGLVWQQETCTFEHLQKCVGVVPVMYKAGDALPSFNGTAEVCVSGGEVAEVNGGETLPEAMTGVLVFTGKDENGNVRAPCYLSGKVSIPEVELPPCPIQIGDEKPESDSGVKLYVNDFGHILFNNGDSFVGSKPYA